MSNELEAKVKGALKPKSTNTVKELLQSDQLKSQIARALPTHMTPDRMLRVALTAALRTPALLDCSQASMAKCLLDCSAIGLEPDGRDAYLIPYGKECTLIIGYRGLIELARRSGLISYIHADIVCEGDSFEYSLGVIEHHKINFRLPRGEMYAAYAMAHYKDGTTAYCVMGRNEIDAIKARSKAKSGPWVTDYNEMAKKTVLRRASKLWPMSSEFRDHIEQEQDQEQPIEVTASTPETLLLSDLPDENGEIQDLEAAFNECEPAPENTVLLWDPAQDPDIERALAILGKTGTPARVWLSVCAEKGWTKADAMRHLSADIDKMNASK